MERCRPYGPGGRRCPQGFLDKQKFWVERLALLNRNGLPLEYALTLLRTWSQSAAIHILRSVAVSVAWTSQVDDHIIRAYGGLANLRTSEAQRAHLFLKVKDGGAGLGSTLMRREAAWIGAWEGGFSTLMHTLGFRTLAAFQEAWPAWVEKARGMERQMAARKGMDARTGMWELYVGSETSKRQAAHSAKVYSTAVKQLHASVPDSVSAAVKMNSGPEAGAFLSHDGQTVPMSDEHLRATLRHRQGDELPADGTGICNHKRANKAICGKLHGRAGGEHALSCKIGGGVEKRHNDIRDALRDWLGTVNVSCMTEQECRSGIRQRRRPD